MSLSPSTPGTYRSTSLSHLSFNRPSVTMTYGKVSNRGSKSRVTGSNTIKSGQKTQTKTEKNMEEMQKKMSGFSIVERIIGPKASAFLSKFLGLDNKPKFDQKIRRIIMLMFIFFAAVISFVYVLYTAYLLFVKNEALVSFTNNIVCLLIYVFLIFLMMLFPKVDFIFFGLGILNSCEQITMASIQGLTGIRTGSEFNFISVSLFAAVFGFETTSAKIFWMSVISANIFAVVVSDMVIYDIQLEIFQKEVAKQGTFDFILDNLFTYFAVFGPTFIFVLAYLISEIYKSFLSKIVLVQKKKIEKVEIIEEDLDILIEEKLAEKDESVAHLKIDKNLFEVPMDDIRLKKVIGEGGGGAKVYVADWKGKEVAFKLFKTQTICESQDNFGEFEKELSILASIAHPNILKFYGASLKPPRVGILMEYCKYRNIRYFLHKYRKKNHEKFPIRSKLKWLVEITAAIDFLHSKRIIHRDIKCENVLITDNYETRLMDFGLSKSVANMDDKKTSRIGTSIYMAPEVYSSGKYSEKCDVYSFGIMIFEIITENFDPYGKKKSKNRDLVIEFKVSQDANFRPHVDIARFYYCKWLVDLMKLCWNHNPDSRPSFSEANAILLENMKNEEGEVGVRESLLAVKKAKSNFNVIKDKVNEKITMKLLQKKVNVLEDLLKKNNIEIPIIKEDQEKEDIVIDDMKVEIEEKKEEEEEKKREE